MKKVIKAEFEDDTLKLNIDVTDIKLKIGGIAVYEAPIEETAPANPRPVCRFHVDLY